MSNSKKQVPNTRRKFLRDISILSGGIIASPKLFACGSFEDFVKSDQTVLKAVALGDSAMWGQGLAEADKYTTIAASLLSQKLRRPVQITTKFAHSGAAIESSLEQRKKFAKLYPARFGWTDFRPGKSTTLADNFVKTSVQDENPAVTLFEEIPSTFPTISHQVRRVSTSVANDAEILFLNGGANDLDFETFLNPLEDRHNFVHKYEPLLQEYTYERVKALLTKARRKFPNAVILYIGYFSPFVPDKSNGHMRKLLEDMSGYERYKIVANKFFNYKNPDQLVTEAQYRSQYGLTRGIYYTRKAIAELNNDSHTRGPGILFIHPAFTPNESVFADESCFHQNYKPSTVKDAAKDLRWQNIPRKDFENDFGDLRLHLTLNNPIAVQKAQHLVTRLDGSKDLVNALNNYMHSPSLANNFKLRGILTEELDRIDHAKIASFLHPNERGARKYANAIVSRYTERLQNVQIGEDLAKFAHVNGSNEAEKLNNVLGRYNLQAYNTNIPNASQMMLIDSIAIEIRTTPNSEKKMYDNVFLRLSKKHRWQLNFPFEYIPVGNIYIKRLHNQFNPGFTDLFTIDGMGMHLSEIDQLVLEREKIHDSSFAGAGPYQMSWIRLYLNGIKVFSADNAGNLQRDNSVHFRYPV